MTIKQELKSIISNTDRYNLHSHTQFCDGRATIREIVNAAFHNGFEVWGVTPHSPICVESPCNMSRDDVPAYLDEMMILKEDYEGRMKLLTGMEVDFISPDFGPHIDYFRNLPLDFRIGSVHFVPTQDGRPLDCDGSFERFSRYLVLGYKNDLRYVVEKYFEHVLTMLELGGFDILGHFDKIIGNAFEADPTLETQNWYEALVENVIRLAKESGVIVEINTKAIHTKNRFFPAERWWPKLKASGVSIAVNSDCHYTDRTNLGREEALERYRSLSYSL